MSLQGTLKTLGITEVLEFLANRDATGQLDVETDLGKAVYLFSHGQVAQSEYAFNRESGSDPAEATYYVVSEIDGTFLFDEDQEPIDIDSCEDVSSVLNRTAGIAEKWLDVEATIASPNDVLTRNNELDGSVTIQPEWWKALEVIGSGKSSLDVASALDMGLLDASMLLLAMTNAGLLIPGSQELPVAVEDAVSEPAEVALDEPPVHITTIEPMQAPAEAELPVEPLSIDAPEPVAAPVEAFAPEPVAAPVEAFAPEPVAAPVEAFAPEPVAAPVEAFAPEPVAAPVEAFAPEPVAAPVEAFAPEPVAAPVEAFAPEPVAAPVEAVAPEPAIDDDDGWASNHSPSYEPTQASFGGGQHMPAPPEMPAPVAPVAAAEPGMPTTQIADGVIPSSPAMPETDPNEQSTALAGEVLSDLAELRELDGSPQHANWQLDGTFVADEAPTSPQPDADPFGALDELLDDSDEDRGSVLKFLRRD